jgi:hypothetical protein
MSDLARIIANMPDGSRGAIEMIIAEIAGAAADKITGELSFDCDFSQGALVSVRFRESRTIYRVAKNRKIRSPGI